MAKETTILCKFLVSGPTPEKIETIMAILASREVEGNFIEYNNKRPSSIGPVWEDDRDNKKYWIAFWSLPKSIYEKKFGPYIPQGSNDENFHRWKKGKVVVPSKKLKKTRETFRPFQVYLSEDIIQALKKQCSEMGVSVSQYMSACACYLLDYEKLDKDGNPNGFREIISVLGANIDNIIPETPVDDNMTLKFRNRKPIKPTKTMRDYIISYLLDDPTPDHFISKKDLAEKMGTTTRELFDEKNRDEYNQWEQMFENLKDGNLEQTYSPEISYVIKDYLKQNPDRFIKKYEIAERLGTTAIKLFNMKTPDCEKNRREYDRWKKKFNDGNF